MKDSPNLPPLPETPLEALGPTITETVLVDGQSFLIQRPSESDKLVDHPYVARAFATDEYLPYWADLWPAARMLAKSIARESWPPGLEAIEIGCGLGLPGIVALSRGLRVTFSDYDATALRFAANNAELNGLTGFKTLQMDWRAPVTGLQVPVVFAADLIYELRNVAPIIDTIKRVLQPGGLCLLADQERIPTHTFRETLAAEGFDFTTEVVRAGSPGGPRVRGMLYRIRHRP